MKRISYILILLTITISGFSQKSAYIPAYLLDTTTVDGQQFTWTKTAQSANFTLIWGDSAGVNPLLSPDPSLIFNPTSVLDTMEYIYQSFVNYGFAQDTIGTNLNLYKIPIVMLNTFGPSGATGWAFGGDADGIIGAFWAHPLAMQDGGVAAHEPTHSLQAQAVIDYRTTNGLGSVWNNAGIFWETHANFMRNLLYPQAATASGMDVYHIETWGDWKNTYENYQLLFALMETDGIGIVNRLWRESLSHEYPLQTYKRLMNFTQQEFNDKMFEYARRMATYDFSTNGIGQYFRQYRNQDLQYSLHSIQATYTVLKQDTAFPNHYQVPIELAPEEYAYNVIPIYPNLDSCSVIVKFLGHLDANSHAGWRYGFVAAYPNGTLSRYSDTYSLDSTEIAFSLLPGESNMYLVIMGAPHDDIQTDTSNDTWRGYPKHFRYPYEVNISGGLPEGFQGESNFRTQLKTNGTLHSNGGGWMDANATVSQSVYIGPYAMVLGYSSISGNVRIENTALVKDASLSGNVQIKNNAFVSGGTLTDSAIVNGQGFAENDTLWDNALIGGRAKVSNYKLHGNIEVGGDVIVYNISGDCDNGVYYRMTNYYEDNLLECDGRTAAHPANSDVNNTFSQFSPNQLALFCNCTIFPNCLTVGLDQITTANDLIVYPNPTPSRLTIEWNDATVTTCTITLYNALGLVVLSQKCTDIDNFQLDLSQLPQGLYTAKILAKGKAEKNVKIIVQR